MRRQVRSEHSVQSITSTTVKGTPGSWKWSLAPGLWLVGRLSHNRKRVLDLPQLSDQGWEEGLVEDARNLEREADLPKEPSMPLGGRFARQLDVAEGVQLKRQLDPWLHRIEGC